MTLPHRRTVLLALIAVLAASASASAFEKLSAAAYHARRVALASKLGGGVAILFAGEEPILDFMPYRQEEDFFYLTGWTEPGAALMIVADAPAASQPRKYREVMFFPTRNLRVEKFTGVKLDAATPNAAQIAGVDEVLPMTGLAEQLNRLVAADPRLPYSIWIEAANPQSRDLIGFTAATLGLASTPPLKDVSAPIAELRVVKSAGEIALMQKASEASIAAQRVMMQSVRPGVTERTVTGKMIAAMMENGCERPSYAPIVGSGRNSTVLHYSENSATMAAGDLVVVDAAGEYSMYASDITRTVPVSGHFTPRQREVYNVVLGAQRAAMSAFVAGKSTINDAYRQDPNSLDTVAWNYIHDHGKGPHGEPLTNFWVHGLGHMVGINVHDPAQYPAVLRPGMVFTIEPGVYIPQENLGVRIEDVLVVGQDGKLIDLVAALPHTADEVEAAMKSGTQR